MRQYQRRTARPLLGDLELAARCASQPFQQGLADVPVTTGLSAGIDRVDGDAVNVVGRYLLEDPIRVRLVPAALGAATNSMMRKELVDLLATCRIFIIPAQMHESLPAWLATVIRETWAIILALPLVSILAGGSPKISEFIFLKS